MNAEPKQAILIPLLHMSVRRLYYQDCCNSIIRKYTVYSEMGPTRPEVIDTEFVVTNVHF